MATAADVTADEEHGQGAVAALQAEVTSLRRRLELLERENQMLLTRVSNCSRCSKFGVKSNAALQEGGKSNEFGVDDTLELFRDLSPTKHIVDLVKEKLQQVTGTYNEPDKCLKHGLLEELREHGLREELTGCRLRTTHHHPKRYIALKIVYFGQRFYGFASEAQKEPTIESEIFKALDKTKLSVGNKHSLCYSRCGRTDKGVSSTGQIKKLTM